MLLILWAKMHAIHVQWVRYISFSSTSKGQEFHPFLKNHTFSRVWGGSQVGTANHSDPHLHPQHLYKGIICSSPPRLHSQTQSLLLKSHLVLTTTSEAKNQGHITKEETEAYETSGYCQGLSLHMDESRRTVSALYPHGNFLFLQLSNLPWCTSLFCLHWCTDTNKKKIGQRKRKKIGRQRQISEKRIPDMTRLLLLLLWKPLNWKTSLLKPTTDTD